MKTLVVDDQESIRLLLTSVLKKMGLESLEANDGDDALRVLREEPDIGLVILDMKMPRVSGREACEKIIEIRPEVRILISSAHVTVEEEATLQGMGVKSFLKKPFRLSDLREAVKQLAL